MNVKTLLCVCILFLFSTSAFGQEKFKVFSESICDGNSRFMSFLYGSWIDGDNYSKNLRIDVALGGCGHDPSVSFSEGKIAKNYIYYSKPTERFVDEKTKQNVNATLKKLLLDVYNLAAYCNDNNLNSGILSETGRFTPLAELRQYLKIGSIAATVKEKPIPTKSSNAAISESDLREQMMSDGLHNSLKGCEGMLVNIKQTKVDLNRDGQNEIIVIASSGCWGMQGMKTWIYQRSSGRLKALLTDADGGYIFTVTSTRGFRDITLSSRSYIDVYTKIYKYNGREYEYFVSKRYQRNKSGKLILKETYN